MAFLKPLLLLATLLPIALTAREIDCPVGWLPNTFHGTKCCSGNMVIDEEGAYCCVYDMREYKEALTNTAKLYATATTTAEESEMTGGVPCFAKIRFTASDYSAQVSSAAQRAEATPTDTSASETTTTTRTSDSGPSSTSGSQASTPVSTTGSQTSAPASTTGSQTSTPTSNGVIPLATGGEAVLTGAVFAAALFML
ncbi:hypothetical protein BDV26DRAFT_104210 [Aspergillus bertholletiae]|uniref:Extracellular membrane protein CFEM domain-containing protein n=1 Tax=Aspergillus bertholletiae TaxID=1226010 RepID=A0A5N7AQX6_9EURO|nr:hypothetical protein BDV26DRAFT_104210 [Aspergillus bertholletiae]